jgi:hypothetical protein
VPPALARCSIPDIAGICHCYHKATLGRLSSGIQSLLRSGMLVEIFEDEITRVAKRRAIRHAAKVRQGGSVSPPQKGEGHRTARAEMRGQACACRIRRSYTNRREG